MTTSLPLPAALRGFRLLMSAQFVSGLADSALLLVAIGRLAAEGGPVWLPPLLKLAFTLAYVLLAPFVGPLADRAPKATVMSAANALKAGACAAMALGAPVGPCFALAGAGAALYSPAKYGLVTELMPPRRRCGASSATSRAPTRGCGVIRSGASRWPPPRCSGASAPRCSSWCCAGPRKTSA